MLNTWLNSSLIRQNPPNELYTRNSFSQIRKLRPREVRSLAWNHTALRKDQDSNLGFSHSRTNALTITAPKLTLPIIFFKWYDLTHLSPLYRTLSPPVRPEWPIIYIYSKKKWRKLAKVYEHHQHTAVLNWMHEACQNKISKTCTSLEYLLC